MLLAVIFAEKLYHVEKAWGHFASRYRGPLLEYFPQLNLAVVSISTSQTLQSSYLLEVICNGCSSSFSYYLLLNIRIEMSFSCAHNGPLVRA